MVNVLNKLPSHKFELDGENIVNVIDIDGVKFALMNQKPEVGDTVFISFIYSGVTGNNEKGEWIRKIENISVDEDTGELIWNLDDHILGETKITDLYYVTVLKRDFEKEKVTKSQQEMINDLKKSGKPLNISLDSISKTLLNAHEEYPTIKGITIGELSQAWWEIAEVTPDYISPQKAYEHFFNSGKVLFDDDILKGRCANIESFIPFNIKKYNRKFYVEDLE